MKKKILGIVLAVSTLFAVSSPAFADSTIKVLVGGERLITDVDPIIIEGRTMLPLRAVFEEIGAWVDYIHDERKVIAGKDDTVVEFVIDSNIMTINGEPKEIDVPATIVDGRTLVPVRACAEAFDLKVDWDGDNRIAMVRKMVSLPVEGMTSDGCPQKWEYDEKGNEVYHITEDRYWMRSTYDVLGQCISTESEGDFVMTYTYDEKGNKICEENNYGFWTKYTYNEDGEKIYSENSDGYWEKWTYGDGTYLYETSDGYWHKSVSTEGSEVIEDSEGYWEKHYYDENGGSIERADGYWEKWSYDENGTETGENSYGEKYTVTHSENEMFRQYEDGRWEKNTFNETEHVFESSDGYWSKDYYDANGNNIYYEDAEGFWNKHEYDENGNLTYEEYSTGAYIKYIVVER